MGHATSRIRLPEDPSEDLEPVEEPTQLYLGEHERAHIERKYEDTNLKMISYLCPSLPVSDQIRDCVMSAHLFQIWEVCDVIRVFPCFATFSLHPC